MVGIKDFGIPSCCMNCEMFDGEYGNCDIIGDTQDFEYQWNENRPFDCPLVEAIQKADYEARLKADLKAILVELQLEIHELENPYPDDYDNLLLLAQHNAFYDAKSTIEDLVDEKIKED